MNTFFFVLRRDVELYEIELEKKRRIRKLTLAFVEKENIDSIYKIKFDT